MIPMPITIPGWSAEVLDSAAEGFLDAPHSNDWERATFIRSLLVRPNSLVWKNLPRLDVDGAWHYGSQRVTEPQVRELFTRGYLIGWRALQLERHRLRMAGESQEAIDTWTTGHMALVGAYADTETIDRGVRMLQALAADPLA